MRKFIVFAAMLAMVFTITGCSSSYERDTSAGKVESVLLGEACAKKNNKETFVLYFSLSTCGSCADFKKVLEPYLKNHNLTVYEVVLDKEQATQTENVMIIENNFQNFSSTPNLIYIKEGKQVADLQVGEKGITKDMLEEWVVKHNIDEKGN